MKKTFALMLTLAVLTLALAACSTMGGSKTTTPATEAPTVTVAATQAPTEAPAEATVEPTDEAPAATSAN